MKRRLVIVTEIIAPYRIPLFNTLAKNPDVELQVIFLAEGDPQFRQWETYKAEIQFSYRVLPSWRRHIGTYNILLNRGVSAALAEAAPHAILCGGYNYVASWQALSWARRRGVPFFLWSESHAHELRQARLALELLKRRFIRRCSGFVVPGKAAHAYLRSQQVDENLIFVAPNAVDNDFFSFSARAARQTPDRSRRELELPARYFLFAGRLVRAKGVFELLAAYAKLEEPVRQRIGLVFAGDGPLRAELQQQAAAISPGTVRFAGFAQKEKLAIYYALAEMLILPTYTDAWGLVVNEAMACGLPVILSSVAGCAPDLMKEDWNGVTVPPREIPALTSAMRNLACNPDMLAQMGIHSAQHIRKFSPAAWAGAIAAMLAGTEASRA
ncbi:MAG TPA: glycosyltransferase family 4 protein [Candidatus Sulfotelmatobacter sp.]|jgi:glycosyltransferase involved in cell wall biosynthesis